MRGIIFFIACMFWSALASAEMSSAEYWTYRKYVELNPSEELKAKTFSEVVRSSAKSLKVKHNPITVAVVYPGKQVSDYWRRSVASFEARLSELTVPYRIQSYFSEPGVDVRLQEAQIAKALESDPDYLIFTLDAFHHKVMIERIMARGRPKIILQNITTPVKAWDGRQPFLYVGFDHGEGSRLLAERFLSDFEPGTNYAMFYGPRGYVSKMRGGTFNSVVQKDHKARMIEAYYLDFNREKSKKATIDLLSVHKNVPFIYACSTDIALGVIDGAKELGRLGDIKVNGWGGGDKELEAILAKELDFTVMRMNDDNGVAMAEAIAMDLTGRGDQVPVVYSGDMVLVDQSMSADDIEQLKKRAFRYSDHWPSNAGKSE